MIAAYWNTVPKNNPDRQLFVKTQSTKKDPILLQDDAIIPSTNASLPSSSETEKQQSAEGSEIRGEENESTEETGMDYEMEENAESMDITPTEKEKRLPLVIANDTADELDEHDNNNEAITKKKTISDSDFNLTSAAEPSTATSSEKEIEGSVPSSEVEVTRKKTGPKKRRTKPAYSDYFLEEYERKKRHEEGYHSTASEAESTASLQEDDNSSVIFNDSYGINPPLDWDSSAEKVIYIGQEFPESPLYCVMKWKDGVKSLHPLSLVRTKRPDLVR